MSAVTKIPEIEPPKPRRFIKQPDSKVKDAEVAEHRSEIKKLDVAINSLSKEIETTITPKADSEKRHTLTTELKTIIRSQGDIKKKRQQINEQIKAIDQGIKKKISDIQSKTSKHDFKTVDDIDKRIKKLEAQIDTGSLMLVDEKKAFKEISSLNKLKKDFGGIEQQQKSIDSDKAKIVELKNSLSSVTNKEVQARFEEITKDLDELSNKNQSIQSKRDELFGKRRELYKQRDNAFSQIRTIKEDFDAKFKKFKADMDNERKKREEEEKAYTLYLKKKDLLSKIEEITEASKLPAFSSEIKEVETLLVHFDPSYVIAEESNTETDDLDKHSSKTEIKLPENAEIISKKEEAFFVGTAKSKKGKKQNKKKAKFTLEPMLISQLSAFGISLPTSQEEVQKTVEDLKNKLQEFRSSQEETTKSRVLAANEEVKELQDKIDQLDKDIVDELEKEKAKKAASADATSESKENKEEKEEKKEEDKEENEQEEAATEEN